MSRVLVVQEVLRTDPNSGERVPAFDLRPATVYADGGKLEYLLPPGQHYMMPGKMVALLRHKLRDFSDADYLLPTGDPTAMMAAAMVAAQYNGGRVKVLRWEPRSRQYIQVDLTSNGRTP